MWVLFSLIYRILKNKFSPPLNPIDLTFTGKTVVITGSNTGIGYEAALKFAQQNCARLILGVRNVAAGEKVARVLRHMASDPGCKVEVWEVDIGDAARCRRFLELIKRECDRVDVVVLNAGVWRNEFVAGRFGDAHPEGDVDYGGGLWEETIRVNCLGTVALAVGMLEVMRGKWRAHLPSLDTATASKEQEEPAHGNALNERDKPVLEFVSSGRYARPGLITPDELNDDDIRILDLYNPPAEFSAGRQYAASKLFLMCCFIELAKLAYSSSPSSPDRDPDIYVTSVCPGACQSKLSRDLDSLGVRLARFYANLFFLRTAEEGARTVVSATGLGGKGHGRLWQNDEVKPFADVLTGDEGDSLTQRVWSEVREALGKSGFDMQGVGGTVRKEPQAKEG